MSSYNEKLWIDCIHADPAGCICIIYFQDCNLWHVLTFSNYTWSRKQIPEVEWGTQEETQPLELPHRLTHICCQIPSSSPGIRYDQQCYQWFTGNWIVLWTLTHPILLVKALRLLIQLRNSRWVTDLCSIPTAFSVTQTDVRKSRKHIIARQKSSYPNLNVVREKL